MTDKPKYQKRLEDLVRTYVREQGYNLVMYVDSDGIRMDVQTNDPNVRYKEFGLLHGFDLIAAINRSLASIEKQTSKGKSNDDAAEPAQAPAHDSCN